MHSATFPKGVGSKFFPDGQVRAYPGNTVLCHVAGIPPLIERLDKLYGRLLDAEVAQIYTLLPPSSWHMTVFDGVCDGNRNGERWPGDLDREAPLLEINQTFEARLKAGRFGPGLSFAMRVRRLRPLMNVIAIELEPADEGEERAVRALRQRLAATLSFDRSAPDTHTFHITLAHFFRFPDASEKARLESLDDRRDPGHGKVFGPLPRRAAGILSFQRYVRFLAPPVSAVNLLPGGALCGQYQACGFELSLATCRFRFAP